MQGDKIRTDAGQVFFYYQHTQLQAVRLGRWKLVLPRSTATSVVPETWDRMIAPEDRVEIKTPMLFDLQTDIGEQTDVAAAHPEVVEELMKQIEWARGDIGDYDRIGKNARFFDPQPKRPDIGKSSHRRTGKRKVCQANRKPMKYPDEISPPNYPPRRGHGVATLILRKIIGVTIMLAFLTGRLPAAESDAKAGDRSWADRLEFVGMAVMEPDYHVWGSSPIMGPDGKTHLFVARWPGRDEIRRLGDRL